MQLNLFWKRDYILKNKSDYGKWVGFVKEVLENV